MCAVPGAFCYIPAQLVGGPQECPRGRRGEIKGTPIRKWNACSCSTFGPEPALMRAVVRYRAPVVGPDSWPLPLSGAHRHNVLKALRSVYTAAGNLSGGV